MNSKRDNRILAIFLGGMLLFVACFIYFAGQDQGPDPLAGAKSVSVVPPASFTPIPTAVPTTIHVHKHVVVKVKHHKKKAALPEVAASITTTRPSHPSCLASLHSGAISIQLVAYHTADDPTTTTEDPSTTTTDPPTTTTDPPTTTTNPPVVTIPVTIPTIRLPHPTTTTKPVVVIVPTPVSHPVPVTTTTVKVVHHVKTVAAPPPSTSPLRRACR